MILAREADTLPSFLSPAGFDEFEKEQIKKSPPKTLDKFPGICDIM
jgi:hypothetical protein